MRKLIGRCAALALLTGGLLLPGSALAASRSYIVTDFDSVRLEAPIAVAIETRRGVSARGEGDADLLDRIDLSVSARVLTIRLKRSPFEGRKSDQDGTASLRLTVPALRRAQLSGSGALAIAGMRGQNADIVASGSGTLSVTGLDSDNLFALQQGSGTLTLAGRAGKASVQLSGSGRIDAASLTAADLELVAEGAGDIVIAAARSAKVTAVGAAEATVTGKAACTVRHAGSGTVTCAGQSY